MKVLLVGGYNLADCLGTIGRAIQYMGHELIYIPARRIGNLDKVGSEILEKIEGIDVLLYWNDRELPVDIIKEVSKKYLTIYWTVDDLSIWGDLSRLDCFEVVITCCEQCKEMIESKGKKAYVMYPAIDVDYHYFCYREDFVSNVSLVMTHCYTKSEFPTILFDRSELVKRLYKDIGNIMLWGRWGGRGWGNIKGCDGLEYCYKGFRKFEMLAPVFSSAKINVSTHVVTNHKGYLNHRNFEVMGCRGFLMVDKVAGIENIFEDKKYCVFYESLDDLIEKAKWYLTNDRERFRIAYEGNVYAVSRFNAFEWVRKLEKIVFK